MCLTLWRNVRPVGRPHLCDRCIHHPDGEASESSTTRPRLTRRSAADCGEKTRPVEPPPHSTRGPPPPTPPRSPPLPPCPIPPPAQAVDCPPSMASADAVSGQGCTVQPHLAAAGRGSPTSPADHRVPGASPDTRAPAANFCRQSPDACRKNAAESSPDQKNKDAWGRVGSQPQNINCGKTTGGPVPGFPGEDRDRPPGVWSDRVGGLGQGARPTPFILPRPLRVRGRREPPRLRSVDSRGSPSGESSGCGAAVSAAPSTRSAEFVRGSP